MPLTHAPYEILPSGESSLVRSSAGALFDGHGGLSPYAVSHSKQAYNIDYVMEPNTPFEATLTVVKATSGHLEVKDEAKNRSYLIQLSYLVELLKMDAVREGRIHGRWVVAKTGAAFGLRLAD